MQVYKFGGASVATAIGIKNVYSIILKEKEAPIVVISAMGKMTNAFEILLEGFIASNKEQVSNSMQMISSYHTQIIDDLKMTQHPQFDFYLSQLNEALTQYNEGREYDYWYDQIVSYGEMLSTSLFSDYLSSQGCLNKLLDAREVIITDSRFRDANIEYAKSTEKLNSTIKQDCVNIIQGFIAGDSDNNSTTLGREGSDYTAAAIANMLDCNKVTIWKDVDGVLNADPRLFDDCILIPRLSYVDAVELAFSGAQIIHPKTIKPLQNKNIPLHVRSFINHECSGSVIHDIEKKQIDVPIIIVRKNQVLLSMRPMDFSFALEESLQDIFTVLNSYNQKVNTVQASAVRISISIDHTIHFNNLLTELSARYKVKYNDNLELLTIRGDYNTLKEDHIKGYDIFVKQETRRALRLLRKPKIKNDTSN